MTLRAHALFWALATSIFFAALWILKDTILPFILGLAIAYLLGPVVARMIRAGVPRGLAATAILVSFIGIVALILAMIIPFVYRELVQLTQDFPGYADQVQVYLTPYMDWLKKSLPVGDLTSFQSALQDNLGRAFRFGGTLAVGVIDSGRALGGFVISLILTPIVAFFMLEEWVRITKWIDDMIPRKHYDTVRDLLSQIDRKLSGFIRGQLMVSLILGIAYAVILFLAGLKFGFLIGLSAGILSIIPLIGSSVGLIVSIAVAWFQTGDIGYAGSIAAIFLVGQFIEGHIITPRIMGKSVGLHPLWILFALVVGGGLFGITGMFLAVPVAAVIGVLAVFAIAQYRESPYYGEGQDRSVRTGLGCGMAEKTPEDAHEKAAEEEKINDVT